MVLRRQAIRGIIIRALGVVAAALTSALLVPHHLDTAELASSPDYVGQLQALQGTQSKAQIASIENSGGHVEILVNSASGTTLAALKPAPTMILTSPHRTSPVTVTQISRR